MAQPTASASDLTSSLERLEARIAPASLASVRTAEFAQALPEHGSFPIAAAADLAVLAISATPSAPTVFTTENAGFILSSTTADFDTPGFKGSIDSIVVRRSATTDPVTQPVGGLDFYYQVTVSTGDPRLEVNALTLGGFVPFLVDAGIDPRVGTITSSDPLNGRTGGSQAPVLFSYSGGSAVFGFKDGTVNESLTLAEPQSRWMVLRTNAQSFHSASTATISGLVPDAGAFSTSVSIPGPTETTDVPTPLLVTGSATGSLVRVFNPTTGALTGSFDAFGPRNRHGVRVATGDVNGDGVEDIIAGSGGLSPGGAQVRVFDGANPSHPPLEGVLGNFRPFGRGYIGAVNVAAGDVNGDGQADIIVAPASGSSGQVRVFSGADGTLLSRFTALQKVNGGVRVAAGDVNGDGRDEVIVGAGLGSAVRVFNGLTGVPITGFSFQSFEAGFTGGVNVAAGDVNGDGIDEIFVGTGAGTGRVRIFDQALVRLAEIQTGSLAGARVVGIDTNGDTYTDLAVAQGPGGSTLASVFDGLSRSKRFDLSGYPVTGTTGLFIG